MTATNPARIVCPACEQPYGTTLDNGLHFCPSCRHEWNPADVAPVVLVGRQLGEPIGDPADVLDRADGGETFQTVVDVEYREVANDAVRTDRETYITPSPHTAAEALDWARDLYVDRADIAMVGVKGALRAPDVDPEPEPVELEPAPAVDVDDPETTAAVAAAYLDTLTGTGITLDGGQRAVLLDFPDDDHARVQLGDGSTAVVDFNDIVQADNGPPDVEAVVAEVDDKTAKMFGDAVLTMAALVLEAGIASVSGTGAGATLVETPAGWFVPDEDAIPLMEQAAAVAVATLVMAFDLPRDLIATAADHMRPATRETTTTEEQGNDTNTSES